MLKLLPILCLSLTFGCAYNCAKLYDPTTGKVVAKSRTYTFWDSDSSLAKLHIDSMPTTNSHGSFSPGISISGLNQTSTSSNINELASKLFEGGARGIVDALKNAH
jgi:hypothetical protein